MMEKAAVTLASHPGAMGLGKEWDEGKVSCVCSSISCNTGSASSAVSAGPSHMMELQLPGATQGVTLTRNELSEQNHLESGTRTERGCRLLLPPPTNSLPSAGNLPKSNSQVVCRCLGIVLSCTQSESVCFCWVENGRKRDTA